MELAFSFLPIVVTLILLLELTLWFLLKRVTRFKSNLPPGPWTLPFIGALHHLVNAGLPHHALRNLARLHGPVMLLRAGQMDLVILTSREAVSEVIKKHDVNLTDRAVMHAANTFSYGGTDIVFSSGAYWRQLRRICSSELLSSKRVKCFSSIREEEINSLLKSFSILPDKSTVNLTEKIMELTSNIVIRAAFGGKCKNRGLILQIVRDIMELISAFTLSDLFPSLSWLNVNMGRKITRLHR